MMSRRVFIIWVHPLFYDTIRLLIVHPEVEVVGAGSVYTEALAEIEKLQPDTVIVEETEENKREAALETLRLLETSSWCSRIVRISLQDNDLWIYQREQRTISNKNDLLQIISS